MLTLDEVLNDGKTERAAPETHESRPQEPRQQDGDATTETVKTQPKSETKAPADDRADEPDAEDEHTPDDLSGLKRALAAARGDKRKARRQWQEAERAMAELRGRFAAQEQFARQQQQRQQPKPEAPKPVDISDEDFYGKGPASVKAYVDAKQAELERRFEQRAMEQRQISLARSERAARKRHTDYDEVFSAFREVAQRNPQLIQSVIDSDDPGEEAYVVGKTYLATKDVDSIDDLEAKIEKRLRAQLEAEYRGQSQQQQRAPSQGVMVKPTIPRTIAASPGNGVGAPQAWAGPPSLDEILR